MSYPDDPFEYTYVTNKLINNTKDKQILILINTMFYKEKETNNNKSLLYRKSYAKLASLNSILNNSFYNNEYKEYILNIFSKAQKCYYGFIRLKHIWKLKRNKIVVNSDLSLNALNINNKNTFMLVEDKSNYLFNINEIINIIETALCNSPNFFSEPLSPLNPYNNQQLSHSALYNIYFQSKLTTRVVPFFFHCYFLSNFNLHTFSETFESDIRQNAIHNFVFKSPYNVLFCYIVTMLEKNKYTKNLIIDLMFPKDLLVEIFRPFLFHYFMSKYYIKGTTKIYNSKIILDHKLKKFVEYNRTFGRKLYKGNGTFIYDTKHISFYDIPINLSLGNNMDCDTDTDTDTDIDI